MKYVIEGTLTDIETEDSGRVLVAHTHDLQLLGDNDERFFVRLYSYQDSPDQSEDVTHPIMEAIREKRIRITVETLEEDQS